MDVDESPNKTMRTVRFHECGEPVEVLRLDRIDVPSRPPAASASPCMHAD